MNVHSNKQMQDSLIDAPDVFGRFKKELKLFQSPFSERRALLLAGDSLLLILAVTIAMYIWLGEGTLPATLNQFYDRWYWFPILITGWLGFSWLNDLYDVRTANRKSQSAVRVGVVCLLGLATYLVIFFFNKDSLPRMFFLYFLMFAAAFVVTWRWTYAIVFSAPPFRHRVLIVGGNDRGVIIANALKQEPLINYNVLGFVDNNFVNDQTHSNKVEGIPLLGKETDLPDLVKTLKIHEVVIAIEKDLEKDLFLWLVECQANGVRVSWMPDLYEKICRKVPIQHIDPAWALHAMQDKSFTSRMQQIAKRITDLALVILALPILVLIIPCIAVAVRVDSSGPAFYRQIRCGQAGKPFAIYKFRTMVTNAEVDGAKWAQKNDARITRMGSFLRKSRLDELPQLFNVLKGDMSIVGPRPERPEFVEKLEAEIPFYRTRLMVKPGITGWAQVHYDYGNTVEDALIKLQYDFYYIRYQSLALDVYTMFRTVGVLFMLKGM